MTQQATQRLDLPLQQTSSGAGQAGRGADDGGVGPVGRAKGVVHVEVLALHQTGDERRVVGLLSRVEPQVLHELDAGCQLRQALTDRLHGEARVGLAVRPPEVTARRDLGPPAHEPFDRRQRGAQAKVVVHLGRAAR